MVVDIYSLDHYFYIDQIFLKHTNPILEFDVAVYTPFYKVVIETGRLQPGKSL